MTPAPPYPHAAIAALLLLAAPAPAAAFEFNAVLWPLERSPIPLELHEATIGDLTITELEAIIRRSVATWNEVPCAAIALDYAGTTSDRLEQPNIQDDRQLLEFISDEERWVYGAMTAGITLNTTLPEAPESPQVDIAFNGVDFMWVEGGAGARRLDVLDPETVITHELGHLLGLGHTNASNAATMAAGYLPDLGQRALAFDDKAGLCARYWSRGDECDTNTDCPDGHTCDTFTDPDGGEQTRLCSEPHGSWGDPCSGDDLNCVGTCVFTTSDASSGFCSARCAPDDPTDCPDGWSCRNTRTAADPSFICLADEPPQPDAGVGGDAGDGGDTGMQGDPGGCDCSLTSNHREHGVGWWMSLVTVASLLSLRRSMWHPG